MKIRDRDVPANSRPLKDSDQLELATVDPEELLVHAKLEAGYIVFQLRPHHVNFSKRLVKAPKLYFYDAGVDVIIEEGGVLSLWK